MIKRKAPWPDFKGNPIHEGDLIRHPTTGDIGMVKFLEGDIDEWRVDYADGFLSRLCLQIGEKGQAVVHNDVDFETFFFLVKLYKMDPNSKPLSIKPTQVTLVPIRNPS